MVLVVPAAEHLPSYLDALERGWSRDNVRVDQARREELDRIAADPSGFIAAMTDREALGGPVPMPDGSSVPRLPGYRLWMWDGELCGVIGFRWQRGTHALPAHCLGHVGYSVVPWKQRLGHATQALRQLLPLAKREGLQYIHITTDPDNLASQKVIEANGGLLIERFIKPPPFGSTPGLRYSVPLP
jgi:predicted acetyltransferase